jgi:hypothetical protein
MRLTCSETRKARLAQSYAAALLMACSAASEQSGEDGLDTSDTRAEVPAPSEREIALDDLMAMNQELVDRLVEDDSARAEIGSEALGGQLDESTAEHLDAELSGVDEFRARRAVRLSADEESRAIDLAEGLGISAERVSFLGQLVFVDGDTQLELTPAAQPGALDQGRRAGAVDKGKVLSQVVVTGTPPLAPVVYAQLSGGIWLFNRPDLERNVLLIPDAAPAFVIEDFVTAVAAIADASSADCLEPGFMIVMRQATYEGMSHSSRSTLRTKSVAYEPGACPAAHSACAQFPLHQMIWIVPAAGGDPVLRQRFVTGRRIGIDSSKITGSTSASRATFVHELLHTLGIAHPKAESLGLGQNVSKLVVPGTLAGSCVAGPCAAGTNYPSIMHQATDLGRTNSLQPDDIDVIATLYTSAGGCAYRTSPRMIVPQ